VTKNSYSLSMAVSCFNGEGDSDMSELGEAVCYGDNRVHVVLEERKMCGR
jgi:hypothetical protein